MRASVGVTRDVTSLKRDLLLFDELIVLGLNYLMGDRPEDTLPNWIVRQPGFQRLPLLDDRLSADCGYLIEQGAIRSGPAYRTDLMNYLHGRMGELRPSPFDDSDPASLEERTPRRRAELLLSSGSHPSGVISPSQPMPAGAELVVAYTERIFEPDAAIPLLTGRLTASDWSAHAGTFLMEPTPASSYVAEVVLPRLVLPGDDVPLEDVLAFARDPETRRQVRTLRLWMAGAALSHRSLDEVSLEVDSMLHDFEQHMTAADMRAKPSTVRLIVGIPLELVQELFHLRPRGAFDALFAVQTRRAERLESELRAPGHEVAFLRTASKRFGE